MKLSLPFLALVALVAVLQAAFSSAEEPRPAIAVPVASATGAAGIVTVDMPSLFESYPKARDAEAKIAAERTLARKELDERLEKRRRLFDEITKFDEAMASGKLAITTQEEKGWLRGAKVAALQTLDGQIREFQATREKALQESSARLREEIAADLQKGIATAPALADVTLLLDRRGITQNGIPLVLYSDSSLDRSGSVQQQMVPTTTGVAGVAPTTADVRLATLDLKKVFAGYYKSKEAGAEIDAARTAVGKALTERATAYTTAAAALKTMDTELAGVALVGAARKTRAKERIAKAAELLAMEKETATTQNTGEKEIQESEIRLRTGIIEDIHRVIEEAAKAEGHANLVLDTSGAGLNDVPVLLRAEGIPDWTEAVVARLNQSKPGAGKSERSISITSASATGLRFGTVDMKRVFEAIPSVQAAEKALSAFRAQPSATGTDRPVREKELAAAATRKRTEVLEKMNKALGARPAPNAYPLVIDSGARSSTGLPLVMVRPPASDLSDEIIAALGGATP